MLFDSCLECAHTGVSTCERESALSRVSTHALRVLRVLSTIVLKEEYSSKYSLRKLDSTIRLWTAAHSSIFIFSGKLTFRNDL